jgi:N-acetylglucosaminyldiphosphoundecaprenol N-acetyl-beta-D-mannosaminyltransferase
MIYLGDHPVLGVRISAVDYEYATVKIIKAARKRAPLSVAALAVHGVMTGFTDRVHRRRLNGLDLIVPDGQPVRWALNWVHRLGLSDRVRGPELSLRVVEAAAREGLPVYFYGTTQATLYRLVKNLERTFPELVVAGAEPSKFRRLSRVEKLEVVDRIQRSEARLVFVGLGCPRQEVWVYEYRECLRMPLLAVGAAFSFHAGQLSLAPHWMQRYGLEWLYRLVQEPGRLWKRYLLQGPVYLTLVLLEAFSIFKVPALMPDGTEPEESYG